MTRPEVARLRAPLRFGLLWLVLFLAGTAWGISTPLGASPDEPAHIIKAASVARGQLLGATTDEPAVREVTVNAAIAESSTWPCYAFDGTAEASCLVDVPDADGDGTARTSAGLYNPVFYALIGWPTLIVEDASLAVMMMRAVNAFICAFFLTVAFAAASRLVRSRVVLLGFAAAVTPMVLFLNGSVNPNGLEISAGAALGMTLLLLVRRAAVRAPLWLAAAAVSGLLLAQARGISVLWLGVVGIAALVAAEPGVLKLRVRQIGTWITLAVIASGIAFAAWWLSRTGTLGSMGVFPGAGSVTPRRAFVEMLFTRTVDPGYVGFFGWLDAPSAPVVIALWSFLALLVVLGALALARGRMLASVIVLLAALIFVPAFVQAASVQSSGYIWQGRYSLVIYVALLMFAATAIAESSEPNRFGGRQRRAEWLFIVILGGAHGYSVLHTLKRYAVGTDAAWVEFFTQPEWSPPLGLFTWPLVVGAMMSLAMWLCLDWTSSARSQQRADVDEESSATGSIDAAEPGRSVESIRG